MKETDLNLNKNLEIKSLRSWDVRVAEMTGNLNAAILYGQIAHHHKYMGDFSKSDQELSIELNLSHMTFVRTKKLLINMGFISTQSGARNKTVYSIVKKLEYFEKSYRRYDLNHCLINKDINAGILLSYLIYCRDHFLKKGHEEFFKSNECLMRELFLSLKELKRAKKKLIMNGFVMTHVGPKRTTYYTINMEKVRESVSLIAAVPKPTHQKNEDELYQKGPIVVPKGTYELYQKGPMSCTKRDPLINNKDINNIYLGKGDAKNGETICESGLTTYLKEKKISKEKQPLERVDGKHHAEELIKGLEKPLGKMRGISHQKSTNHSVGSFKRLTGDTNQKPKEEIKMDDNSYIVRMIDIWNQTVKKDTVNIFGLTTSFKENLEDVFESKFGNSLQMWEKYCKYLSNDDFRMGRKAAKDGSFFNINLTWALKDESIANILPMLKEKDKSDKGLQDITPSREFLTKEVLLSSDEEWVKKIKVVLIDYLYSMRNHFGLQSYQSYLRKSAFEISTVNGKRELILRSPYNAYNGLFVYHDAMAKAFEDFDKVTIFDNSNRSGNSLYMLRKSTNMEEPSSIWERVRNQHGINFVQRVA